MHYFRQDVDAHLFSLAVSYGAVCHTETRITDVQFDDDGVRLTAAGKGQESRSFHAQYVVDAGGPNSRDGHPGFSGDVAPHLRGRVDVDHLVR